VQAEVTLVASKRTTIFISMTWITWMFIWYYNRCSLCHSVTWTHLSANKKWRISLKNFTTIVRKRIIISRWKLNQMTNPSTNSLMVKLFIFIADIRLLCNVTKGTGTQFYIFAWKRKFLNKLLKLWVSRYTFLFFFTHKG